MSLAAGSLILAGCVGVSSVRYSKPAPVGAELPTRQERFVGEMFVSGDLEFHLYPVNRRSSDWMVFPVPMPTPDSGGGGEVFVVGLALKPSSSGYSFDPREVVYWVTPTIQHHARRMTGPFDSGSSSGRPEKADFSGEPIALAANTCQYMWLEFDAVPPDPKQPFFISIGGLMNDGVPKTLPTMKFEESRRKDILAVP